MIKLGGHNKTRPGFIHLVQQIVTSKIQNRSKEFLECIQRNIDHSNVRYMYILEESWNERNVYKSSLRDPFQKVVFLPFGRQPNYSDIFHIVTNYVEPRRKVDDVWMVSNADIVLGEGFHLLQGQIDNRTILGLSRHASKLCEEQNQCLKFEGSMDSFLGAGPIKDAIIKNVNFKQNVMGAENVVFYEMKNAGYRLLNPCLNIKTYHHHCSNVTSHGAYRINRSGRSHQVASSNWNLTNTSLGQV